MYFLFWCEGVGVQEMSSSVQLWIAYWLFPIGNRHSFFTLSYLKGGIQVCSSPLPCWSAPLAFLYPAMGEDLWCHKPCALEASVSRYLWTTAMVPYITLASLAPHLQVSTSHFPLLLDSLSCHFGTLPHLAGPSHCGAGTHRVPISYIYHKSWITK